MRTIIKVCLLLFLLLLFSVKTNSQTIDSIPENKKSVIQNVSTYLDFQFPRNDAPLITTQVWGYSNKLYFELRYNYENRQTISFYIGRSFKIDSKKQLEIIPMVGGYIGRSSGVSFASTTILEAEWIRGFSQSQYSIDSKSNQENFFYNWSSLSLHVYKPLYIGSSLQYYSTSSSFIQSYVGLVQGIKTKRLILETFEYNFWQSNYMFAIGIQFNM